MASKGAFELREIVDLSLAVLRKTPVRPALASPVHRGDGKTARQPFADDLELFLDEPAALPRRTIVPTGDERIQRAVPHPDAVSAADIFSDRAGRHRIFGVETDVTGRKA
jgi:hypothetical protein